MNVLIVDDSRLAQTQLSRLLAQYGMEVDSVSSGKDCLDYLQTRQMDAVFLDIIMPGMDGFETLRAIADDDDIAKPQIVMCSSADSQQNRTTAMQLGTIGFLPKPYSKRALGTILALLRRHCLTLRAAQSVSPEQATRGVDLAATGLKQMPRGFDASLQDAANTTEPVTDTTSVKPALAISIHDLLKSVSGQAREDTDTQQSASVVHIKTAKPSKTITDDKQRLDTLAPDYERFYRLRDKPFCITPDSRFFFNSSGHKRALDYLHYGLLQREGFIVVTGAPGTGKTALIYALLDELASNAELMTAHLVATQAAAGDLLELVAAAFGLSPEGLTQAALMHRLERFLRARADQQTLLIVDEAQSLSPEGAEVLRMLTNFQVGHRGLLQCFLVGQGAFRKTLQAKHLEALRQRIIASCHLKPLDLEATQQYIEHRLSFAGWRGDPKFTAAAYVLIQQYTEGVPRRINLFCNRLLLEGFLEEAHTITADLVNIVNQELQIEFLGRENYKAQSVSLPLR